MTDPTSRQQPSGWAEAGVTFAGCILGLIGSFHLIAGLTAILNDDFFVRTDNYTFNLDTTAWGWIHLIIGVLLIITAFGCSPAPRGRAWRRSCSRCSARSRTSSSSPTTPSGRSC